MQGKEISNVPFFFPYDTAGVWSRLHSYPEYVDATPEAQREFLQYVLDIIKLDIQGSTLSRMLYQDTRVYHDLFPIYIGCNPVELEREVSFEGKTVVCIPYSPKKLMGAISDIVRDGFLKDKMNYTGFYYPEIELLIVQNGQHHSAVASLRGGGAVTAAVFRLSDAFERLAVSEDFQYWTVNGEPAKEIVDHRFALLYKLAQELSA